MDVLIALNVVAMLIIAVYALNQGFLLTMFLWFKLHDALSARRRGVAPKAYALTGLRDESLPVVTVQLPLYNERYVTERIIAAVSALDYPRRLLHIQVLDDSTDETTHIAQHAVNNIHARGIDIEYIHRDHRTGYKAGALAHGMRTARGEFIAIFDADFIPSRDFLRRVIAESGVLSDPHIGFVQTRWGHLNRDASTLTRAQALLLDMCFVIDQTVRSRMGLLMQFNGSGGIWRRAAIDAAGGWQSDTLTEDLDLSYRAQLAGWRGRYLYDVVCPGELPDSLLAFKQQQSRWARGGAQCIRKLAAPIIHSRLPVLQKLGAFVHITGYFSSLPVVMLAIVTPLIAVGSGSPHALPVWLSALGALPILELLAAQWAQQRLGEFLRFAPLAVILGIGLALSESIAVFTGLLGREAGEFTRTPKSAVQPGVRLRMDKGKRLPARTPIRALMNHSYLLRPHWTVRAELLVGVYSMIICALVAVQGAWLQMMPALFYACCFLGVVVGQIIPGIRAQLSERAQNGRVASRLPLMK